MLILLNLLDNTVGDGVKAGMGRRLVLVLAEGDVLDGVVEEVDGVVGGEGYNDRVLVEGDGR